MTPTDFEDVGTQTQIDEEIWPGAGLWTANTRDSKSISRQPVSSTLTSGTARRTRGWGGEGVKTTIGRHVFPVINDKRCVRGDTTATSSGRPRIPNCVVSLAA